MDIKLRQKTMYDGFVQQTSHQSVQKICLKLIVGDSGFKKRI
jgi:hypothetical protein